MKTKIFIKETKNFRVAEWKKDYQHGRRYTVQQETIYYNKILWITFNKNSQWKSCTSILKGGYETLEQALKWLQKWVIIQYIIMEWKFKRDYKTSGDYKIFPNYHWSAPNSKAKNYSLYFKSVAIFTGNSEKLCMNFAEQYDDNQLNQELSILPNNQLWKCYYTRPNQEEILWYNWKYSEHFSSIQEVSFIFEGLNICDLEDYLFVRKIPLREKCMCWIISDNLQSLFIGYCDYHIVDILTVPELMEEYYIITGAFSHRIN